MDILWKGIDLAIGRFDYRLAIAGGLAAWLVVALGIFLTPLRP